jgi:hypothetical protein
MELERRSPFAANAFTILVPRVEACVVTRGREPKRCGFDNRLHRRLHDRKLGESGKREKIFASAEAASLCVKGYGPVLDLPKKARKRSLFY